MVDSILDHTEQIVNRRLKETQEVTKGLFEMPFLVQPPLMLRISFNHRKRLVLATIIQRVKLPLNIAVLSEGFGFISKPLK